MRLLQVLKQLAVVFQALGSGAVERAEPLSRASEKRLAPPPPPGYNWVR